MHRYACSIFITLCAGCLVGDTQAESSTPTIVRTSIVLKVGPAEISQYAVEKNFSRFMRAANGKIRPSAAATRAWFELFLARQVIIAEALAAGYGQRPEVLRMVDNMERHMLAQTDPAVAQPTDAELHAAYNRLPATFDDAKPSFEEQRPLLEKILLQERRRTAKRMQREQALQAVGLEIAHATAEKLFQRLQAEPPPTAEISEKLIAPLARERLATYHLDGETVTLTVDGWRERFNALFVRELPVDTAQLEAGVQDLVVAEQATRDARRRGIDREPRFVEDRRNFVYYQALDLFEKEKLLPQIKITPAEAEAFYREHEVEFSRPVRARGKLLHFSDATAAMAWMRAERQSDLGNVEMIEVSREAPFSAAPKATEQILRMEAGQRLGPIHTPTGTLVFVKQSVETESTPYSTVAGTIQTKLARTKLDALELKLAREWAPHHSIEDHLRLEEFGVADPIEKPWKSQP